MIAISPNPSLSFDEFIDWYPEDSATRYELRQGRVISTAKPRGAHSKLAGNLAYEIAAAFRQTNQPYFIPKECIVKTSENTGYEPDIIVLDDREMVNEPRWEQESIITAARSIKLAIEVVATNWRDDYMVKFADYEAFGIPEYWIVDYLGLGGRRHIGFPKQPTFTVGTLVEEEYELQQFRQNDDVSSAMFPNLSLSVNQIFA